MEIQKTNFLDMFYKHVSESDWLEGLDLYQAGKVVQLADYSGLITAKIHSNSSCSEVRLKVHPSGRRIQWIECTCPKYRRNGAYCEHMAAFMINIDRERPKLFDALDSNMPIKAPTPRRGTNKAEPTPSSIQNLSSMPTATSPSTLIGIDNAAQKILDHLQGNIHSVGLLAKGPNIRVRIEIKQGHLTHYNLDIDSAAHFLINHPNLKAASPEIRALKVFTSSAMSGCRIFQEDPETVTVERVMVIRLSPRHNKLNPSDSGLSIQADSNKSEVCLAKHYADNIPQGKLAKFEFLPLKTGSKYVGNEYIYIPDRGYWPISMSGVTKEWHDLPLRQTFKDDAAAKLLDSAFKQYLACGPIWVDPNLDQPEITTPKNFAEVKIHKHSKGWFYLDPLYEVGESKISMLDMLGQFRQKKRQYIKKGKNWVKIPDFIKDHDWETDETGKFIKVNSIGLIRLKAALGNFDRFVGSKRVLEQAQSKLAFKVDANLPKLDHTKLNLRAYQHEGYSWMWWLQSNNLHGLLADEMGLGKTHQAMAIMSGMQTSHKDARFLVVAPTTVIDHWITKLRDFCPNLRTTRHHGAKRIQRAEPLIKEHDVIVTSYGILLRDISTLEKVGFQAVILDEAHFIKNHVTSTYRAVCRLDASFRLCLTGTPMENHLGELKSIFDFLIPGYLGSESYFKRQFLTPIESGNAPQSELALQRLIHPFKMRRTKELVLADLPAKVEDSRLCELSAEQARLYQNVLNIQGTSVLDTLRNEDQSVPYLHIFQVLTLLKQICNHPSMLKGGGNYKNHKSGKWDTFVELIDEAFDSGHKVVVYSQYLSMIRIMEDYFRDRKVNHAVLTGKTRNRGAVIDRFQTDPQCQVFCGSLLAGGIGIDLTAASVVIHYDRWWNASKENQASDRVHRIGQQKNVQVFKLITKGTLEEKINLLIQAKQSTFEKFMDQDEEIFRKLSRQQLIELLS